MMVVGLAQEPACCKNCGADRIEDCGVIDLEACPFLVQGFVTWSVEFEQCRKR